MYRALVQSKDRSKTNVMLEDCEDELDSDDDSDCDEDVVEVEVEQVVREVLPPRLAHTPTVAANVLQVFTEVLLLLLLLLNLLRLPQDLVAGALRCEVCDVDCNSQAMLSAHLGGKKHMKKVK